MVNLLKGLKALDLLQRGITCSYPISDYLDIMYVCSEYLKEYNVEIHIFPKEELVEFVPMENHNISTTPTPAIEAIPKIIQQPQAQYSLTDQLKELRTAANKLGLYDAADFIRNQL